MKSPFIFNLIFSLIIAVLGFVLLSETFVSANVALGIGVLVGGIVVPTIVNLFLNEDKEGASQSASTTLYVGNLPYRANEQAVKDHFSEQGKVFSVRLMKDRRTGKRKGYGFVEIDSKVAEKVIKSLNDSEFQERTLKVRLAKEKVAEA